MRFQESMRRIPSTMMSGVLILSVIASDGGAPGCRRYWPSVHWKAP